MKALRAAHAPADLSANWWESTVPSVPRPFRKFEGDPIFWRDDRGILHRCEGADVHGDVRLIWTLCGVTFGRMRPTPRRMSGQVAINVCWLCLRRAMAPAARPSGRLTSLRRHHHS